MIGSDLDGSKSDGVRLIKNAALQLWNSIVMDVPGYAFRNGEPLDDGSGFENPALLDSVAFAGNIAFNVGIFADGADAVDFEALVNAGVTQTDPMLLSVTRTNDGTLDPRPVDGSPALTGFMNPDVDGIDNAPFVGAFGIAGTGNVWISGWTALEDYGYFANSVDVAEYAENATGFAMKVYPNPVSYGMVNLSIEMPAYF